MSRYSSLSIIWTSIIQTLDYLNTWAIGCDQRGSDNRGSFVYVHNYASVRMRRRHTVVGSCVCVSVYLYVCNSHFSKVAKNQALENAVQAQRDNISNLIVLDFWIKGAEPPPTYILGHGC